MSLMTIVTQIETERAATAALRASLVQRLDSQIEALQVLKRGIEEEIDERDRALVSLIDGDAQAQDMQG